MNIGLMVAVGENMPYVKLKDSNNIKNVYCIPGNAGTSNFATNIKTDFNDFKSLLKTIKKYNIELLL